MYLTTSPWLKYAKAGWRISLRRNSTCNGNNCNIQRYLFYRYLQILENCSSKEVTCIPCLKKEKNILRPLDLSKCAYNSTDSISVYFCNLQLHCSTELHKLQRQLHKLTICLTNRNFLLWGTMGKLLMN